MNQTRKIENSFSPVSSIDAFWLLFCIVIVIKRNSENLISVNLTEKERERVSKYSNKVEERA